MAAKSDFAQKLLCDLRLRKERMAASQGSARDNAAGRDAYRSPGNVQRGSRQTKSLESIGGSRRINQQPISSRGSDRALGIKESSQQIVSYAGGQHRRSESIGDLSMAFTYAVKNGTGKLMNMDFSSSSNTKTMIDFLHQIGRRSLDVGDARNATVTTSLVKHRPSTGNVVSPALTTFQIKEISKGVQNLYEIIRTSSNGTNIDRYSMEIGKELLKGAKGLEESLRMLVNLEEASELMVNPQRKSRITLLEVDEDDPDDRSENVNRNQVALPRFSFDKPSKKSNLTLTDDSVRVLTHRRLESSGAESVRSVTTVNNTSVRSEKGRISNVIAKLMGLEEVPVKVESYCKRVEITKADDCCTNTINKTLRSVKNVEVLSKDRKSQQIYDPNANGSSRTNQVSNKNSRSGRISERHEKEKNGDQVNEKTHSKRRSPEVAGVEKKKIVRRETSNEIKLVPRNSRINEKEKTQKSKKDSQQIKEVKHTNLPTKELKNQPVEQNVKAKDSTQKALEPERLQQKMMPVIRKKVDSVAISRSETPRTKEEVLKKRNRALNNLSMPSKHKLSVMNETKIKDVRIRKDQKETNGKKLNLEKSEPATLLVDAVSSCKKEMKGDPWPLTSEIVVAGSVERNIETSNILENKPRKAFNSSIHMEQKEAYATRSNSDKSESATHLDDIVPSYKEEIEGNPQITSEIVVADCVERMTETSNLLENKPEDKPKRAFNSSIQVVLMEDEKQLKEILMKDQLFLSTAEALFRLNIPVGFLHVDDHNHHQNENKLKLDCGYEILKRKARSQELSVHPYAKPSIGDMSIRILDELVKQLYKDLEDLRLYGRDTLNEYDEADYLHHMLEKDIHNRNPDINSFWDFGWHIKTFTFVEKDEFVKDVEQEVFHRLVDEIFDDLLSM